MNAKVISVAVFVVALIGMGVAYSPRAYAIPCAILPQNICDGAETPGQGGGVFALLTWVLKAMVALVGIAAVGGVIWAGILYLSAGENASQTKQAKTIIVDVAIGLIAFGLMFLIINWLVPGAVLG